MRLFIKGNKITIFFKFYQYTHHLRGVIVGILLKILPHGLSKQNFFMLKVGTKYFSTIKVKLV